MTISSNFKRASFFPGQLIDYRDFNRLSEQADGALALLCRHLYPGGGIVLTALEELAVTPLEGLSVRVKPGLALLPSGHPIVLSEERVIDLSPFAAGKRPRLLVVGLTGKIRGEDRYSDEEDVTITGFRTETLAPEFSISSDRPAEGCLELFRVVLAPGTLSLRLATREEEWRLPETASGRAEPGTIDLRFRPRIVPPTYAPFTTTGLIEAREALYALEASHRKLTRLFLVDDPFQSPVFTAQLHAELLSRPFQPMKAAFLLAELAEKLSLFLERIERRAGSTGQLDRETLFAAVERLSALRSREVIPRELPLAALPGIAQELRRLVDHAESRYSFLTSIEEALLDLRDRGVDLGSRITLAGHAFTRVDRLAARDEKRVQRQGKDGHRRVVGARFADGTAVSLPGTFLKSGVFALDVEVPDPERALVLILRSHVRRGGSVVHYEMNGKALRTDRGETGRPNQWVNVGLVVPPSGLVASGNRLRIRVEQSDLDYGFFELAAYQPIGEMAAEASLGEGKQ